MAKVLSTPKSDPARVLTGAVVRAASLLQLTQFHLGQVLGLSPATVSRMMHGAYTLDERKKEWELAALFVRLFRSLDALVGSNDSAACAWLNGAVSTLAGSPAELIRGTEGLVRVVQYLDAARGRV